MAQRIELHKKKKKILNSWACNKEKDGRPKSIKGFEEEPKLTNG